MALWPRVYAPRRATPPESFGAFVSPGGTGKDQLRDMLAFSRRWTETYAAFDAWSINGRAFVNRIRRAWRTGEIFTIVHADLKLAKGAGGGAPLVNGAAQTGASLITDGWPNNTTVLRDGDPINVGGLNLVYFATADVVSNGAGQATIPIDPQIIVGGSPADNAAITINVVVFRARIAEPPQMPNIGPTGVTDSDLVLVFQEMP